MIMEKNILFLVDSPFGMVKTDENCFESRIAYAKANDVLHHVEVVGSSSTICKILYYDKLYIG